MNNLLFPLNKKGSHTGLILSFIIFITSLIVIYSVVNIPSNDTFTNKNSIDVLKSNLVKELSHDVIIVRVNSNSSSCVNFNTPNNSYSNLNLIAIDSLNSEIKSKESSENTFLENVNDLTKIYYVNGSLFTNTLAESSNTSCTTIPISSIVYENEIFEKSIIEIINESNNSYNNLKSKLEVPNNNEFKIQFIYSNSTYIGDFEIFDIKSSIYVNSYNINYISNSGKEKTGVIKIGLW